MLILPIEEQQLLLLKNILHSFASPTCLKVNFNESFIVMIKVDHSKMTTLAAALGFQNWLHAFHLYWATFGAHKILWDRAHAPFWIEWKNTSWASPSSSLWREIGVNSVYSSMPTLYLSSTKFPSKVLKQIYKYRKFCLWNGGDINEKGGYF